MNTLSVTLHSIPSTLRKPDHALRSCALLTCAMVAASATWAQGTVLMQGPHTQVTTADIQANLDSLPPERQNQILQSPDSLRAMVENIYLRRAAAARAEKQQLQNDPEVRLKLEQTREGILAEAYVNHRDKSILPNEQAQETYARGVYKAEPKRFEIPAEFQASHILIRGNTPEAQAKAEKLLTDIKAGADFAELAKKHSEDPGNATKGGDLGWFAKGRMVKPFQDAVEALKNPGDISPVVTTTFGYHIIRLDGRKPSSQRPFDEVEKELRAEAVTKAQEDERKKLIRELRAEGKGNDAALQNFIDSEKATRK